MAAFHRTLSMRQIKAARALLDWSQEDLAKQTELSVATIRKLELGHTSPRGKTNQQLIQAFERNGLEFIAPNGVREKPEEITIYEGREDIRRFYEDVEEVSARCGDIVQVWPSYRGFENIVGEDIDLHINAMMKIKERMPHKCIFTEIPKAPPRPWCEYRYLSKHFVDSVPFFVYEDKYVIVSFVDETRPKIIVIQSRAAAAAFRKQFYSMWEKATILESPKEDSNASVKRSKKK